MKFDLYYTNGSGGWSKKPSVCGPYDTNHDMFAETFIPKEQRDSMGIGDTFIDCDGDKWERIA